MTTKHLYLILALAGLIVPYYFFVSFLLAHGPDASAFLGQLFGTPISAFFAVDLLVSSVVFVLFVRYESTRYAIGNWWVHVIPLVAVGLSCALPLFLYSRQRRIDARARTGRRAVESRV